MISIKEFKEETILYKSIFVKSTGFVSAIIILFLIPTYIWFIPPFMVLWVISWIFETKESQNSGMLKFSLFPALIFILFALFCLWQLVGIAYSTDKETGLRFFFS